MNQRRAPDSVRTPDSDVAHAAAVPRHIAFMPDGNRRWARRRQLSVGEGHLRGFTHVADVAAWSAQAGIESITFFLISDENIRHRTTGEIAGLATACHALLSLLAAGPYRVRHLGDPALLPPDVAAAIRKVTAGTAGREGPRVNLAVGYGGRADILQAARALINRARLHSDVRAELTEDEFGALLATGGSPDPDLVVRTSGEVRTSGFLAWQAAYSEWHFSPRLWPDFSQDDLHQALADYGRRHRRLGS
ncbi:short-chain Z-isoprenyl diphosphate synthase [Allocatelliglobosispora scoriae]|uniref:Isoprenyl transferase n=1 Tax=Allocatelliglobosispora scoriae TaxID=643052 RepID=A0A841BMS6_9ACTN|nr:polyprenyl diphosphate synthase [Allocatelliglobosispora scoriae]MBB5868489.1 short-chain Z-isoprenyl diphosphate synthase [Allocatelliglobosispora scoriae]